MTGRSSRSADILSAFWEDPGFLLLDGGLATELEAHGHDLNNPLWSARLLSEQPAAIRDVHQSYLEAGADCLITASYQASFEGFAREGFSRADSRGLLLRSVELAVEAREAFLRIGKWRRNRPLVAASIGPYGAALADGSEYRGNYGVSRNQLLDFHQARWEVLAGSGADLLACETVPSAQEAEVLRALIRTSPEIPVWVSFTCRDSSHLRDGTPVGDSAELFRDCPNVIAVGVNCTAPGWILDLTRAMAGRSYGKEIIVYPNSGEAYDAGSKTWTESKHSSDPGDWGRVAVSWFQAGARLIGGCCRTGPRHIQKIGQALRMISSGEEM